MQEYCRKIRSKSYQYPDQSLVTKSKECCQNNQDNLFDIDINMFIHLRSHQGIPVSLHSSMLQWRHKFTLDVGTEEAIIGIDGILSSTKSYGSEVIRIDRHWKNNFVESEINQFSNPDYYTFNRECNSFVDSIINNKAIANGTVKDAKKVMKLVDKIYSYNSQ